MSHQAVIRQFAASLLDLCDRIDSAPVRVKPHSVLNQCEICKAAFITDDHVDYICDECSNRPTLVGDEEMSRITVQISTMDTPFYDEPIELTAEDIVEEVAA